MQTVKVLSWSFVVLEALKAPGSMTRYNLKKKNVVQNLLPKTNVMNVL